jgi:hypothetical protein
MIKVDIIVDWNIDFYMKNNTLLHMDFIDAKTLITIVHVFWAILGAGSAYMSDAMFFTSMKDVKIEKMELRFMRLGSFMVWLGLGILIISWLMLFLMDIEKYMTSSKFLAKMTIVGVIFLNGIFFHRVHLPRLQRHENNDLPSSDEFSRKVHLLIGSGTLSFLSWTIVVILWILDTIPFSYTHIMLMYVWVIWVWIAINVPIFKRIYHFSVTPHHHKKK